jgi:hypothetical protein
MDFFGLSRRKPTVAARPPDGKQETIDDDQLVVPNRTPASVFIHLAKIG